MARSTRNPHVRTVAALALIAAGLTGVIVDNNGRVGLALFVAGGAGVLYLIGHQLARRVASKLHRPQLTARGSVPKIVGARTIAVAVVAMGVLLFSMNFFKGTDDDAVGRALNYGAWFGFLFLAISLVAVSVATIGRWLSKPSAASR